MMYTDIPKPLNLKSPEVCDYGGMYAELIAKNIFPEDNEKLWFVAMYRLLKYAIMYVKNCNRDMEYTEGYRTTMPDVIKYLACRDTDEISSDIDNFDIEKHPDMTECIETGRIWNSLPDVTKKATRDIAVARLSKELTI